MIVGRGLAVPPVPTGPGRGPGPAGAKASLAPSQGAEAPRIENAKTGGRAAKPRKSLDATIREITRTAEKAEWIGYHVRSGRGRNVESAVTTTGNDGNCGTCPAGKRKRRIEHHDNARTETSNWRAPRQLIVLYPPPTRSQGCKNSCRRSDDCTPWMAGRSGICLG